MQCKYIILLAAAFGAVVGALAVSFGGQIHIPALALDKSALARRQTIAASVP